jgi:hypothetical protein
VPDLTPQELQAILEKLDAVCEQARELQQQIRLKMAEAARRDYPADPRGERRKSDRKRR